jgi:hypothetical protein
MLAEADRVNAMLADDEKQKFTFPQSVLLFFLMAVPASIGMFTWIV